MEPTYTFVDIGYAFLTGIVVCLVLITVYYMSGPGPRS